MRYVTRTITEYAVICARCGARGPWALSREEARDAADADGWVLGTGLCPECYDEPEEYLARALKALDKNPLLREAYKYAISFPGDREVRDPMEIDGLPRYVLYYHYLARKGEADYRFYDGTVAFVVREPERTLFSPDLDWVGAVAVWEENGRVEFSTGGDVGTAVFGNLPK